MTQAKPLRIPRRSLHGVLLLDKPLGLSSNDAVQKVKRLFRAEKAGHTGTLDPLARGLLPVCFGAATKFSNLGLDADKTYEALIQWGASTTTGDAEGEVVEQGDVSHLSRTRIEAACAQWVGPIEQVPPMYSALKVNGKALYEYARQGQQIERQARQVIIRYVRLLGEAGFDAVQHQSLIEVCCSKGTYIRTLAEDIGQTLGCPAHLVGLRRIASGDFTLNPQRSYTLEQLVAMTELQRDALILPPDVLLGSCPSVKLDADQAGRFLSGVRRPVVLPDAALVRVWGPQTGAFLGSAHIVAGELIPTRLLSPVEVEVLLAASPACAD